MFEKIDVESDLSYDEKTDVCIVLNCQRDCLDIYSRCYHRDLQNFKDDYRKLSIEYMIKIIEALSTSAEASAMIEKLKNCPKNGVCPIKVNKNNANIVASSKLLLMLFALFFVLFKTM